MIKFLLLLLKGRKFDKKLYDWQIRIILIHYLSYIEVYDFKNDKVTFNKTLGQFPQKRFNWNSPLFIADKSFCYQ